VEFGPFSAALDTHHAIHHRAAELLVQLPQKRQARLGLAGKAAEQRQRP